MEFLRLTPPSFLGSGNRTFDSAVRSIRQGGPFDKEGCPSSPRVLFVFPEEFKDLANRLFLVLRNGVGPFSGSESWFGFSLSTDNVQRVGSFTIKDKSDLESAEAYKEAIESVLATDTNFDAALVIHEKTLRTELCNPYLYTKFPLLLQNIPTQIVTTDVLDDERTLQWSVANVALGLFAKLGGKPWAINSTLADDTLVVGLNRALVRSYQGSKPRRFHGFATAFSHHGLFLGIRIFPAADDLATYLSGLKHSVASAISAWHEALGKPINLVLHLPKESSRDERNAVEAAISTSGTAVVHSSSILRLTEARHIRLTDSTANDGLPEPGVLVRLQRDRAVLQLTGKRENVVGGLTEAPPWSVRIDSQMGNSPPLRELCEHVFALSYMNWRGINAMATPVTIEYPRHIAELMARFAEAGFNIEELRGKEILEKPWFL